MVKKGLALKRAGGSDMAGSEMMFDERRDMDSMHKRAGILAWWLFSNLLVRKERRGGKGENALPMCKV